MKKSLVINILSVSFLILIASVLAGCGPEPMPPPPAPPILKDAYGVAWGSSFYRDEQAQLRTQRAADLGARWDRWPFQWNVIETSPGAFSWSGVNHDYDTAVQKDRDTVPPLNVVGILNTIPEFYKDENAGIIGLNEPLFLDVQRTQPNPANPWAYFVFTTMNRYSNNVAAGRLAMNRPARNFP